MAPKHAFAFVRKLLKESRIKNRFAVAGLKIIVKQIIVVLLAVLLLIASKKVAR